MIAIISDVHGNFPALEAVLQQIDAVGCESVISLGDVSGYYCMVNECINEFRQRNIVNLLGNHDFYVLGKGNCPRSNTVKKITEYQRGVITTDNLKYLSQSAISLDDGWLSARHGGWDDPVDEYVKEFDFSNCNQYDAKLFCSGHTHIQKIEKLEQYTYFNPGAVGQPRDYDSRAAFAIIHEDNSVELCRVEYDIDRIVWEMKTNGFEERTYECLYRGSRIGG